MHASEHRHGELHRRTKQVLEALGYNVGEKYGDFPHPAERRWVTLLRALPAADFPCEGTTEAVEIDGCFTIERTLVDAFLIDRPAEDWDDLGRSFREGNLCTCGHHRYAHQRNGKSLCNACQKLHGILPCRKFDLVQAVTDEPKRAVQHYAYYVTFAKHIPGDRETPPDVDIIDLGAFRHMQQAVGFVVKKLLDEAYDNAMVNWGEEERAIEEGELVYCDTCNLPKPVNDVNDVSDSPPTA